MVGSDTSRFSAAASVGSFLMSDLVKEVITFGRVDSSAYLKFSVRHKSMLLQSVRETSFK